MKWRYVKEFIYFIINEGMVKYYKFEGEAKAAYIYIVYRNA